MGPLYFSGHPGPWQLPGLPTASYATVWDCSSFQISDVMDDNETLPFNVVFRVGFYIDKEVEAEKNNKCVSDNFWKKIRVGR